jgi:hypothetical protein
VVSFSAQSYYCPMADPDVSAVLRYLIFTGERPIYIASTGGADAAMNIGAAFEEREVIIHDARSLSPAASLDREGFSLQEQHTAVSDFYTLKEYQSLYENEITELVLAAAGGTDALVFDHTLRSDSPAVRGLHTTREPASVIHNDYTDASARKRLLDLLPEVEARRRLQQRFAVVNVWRSIAGTVWKSPLACCDATSLAPDDLVPSERRAQDRIGELELVSWNPAHRWFYYPRMTDSEVLLIKTFDSAQDGRATRSVHSAFDDPQTPADAPPRESIESRMLVFFN